MMRLTSSGHSVRGQWKQLTTAQEPSRRLLTHPATRHHAGSDAATDMARTADARKEADTLAALLAKGAVPEDLGEAAGPERLRDLLRALEPVSRNKM